ncbi:hypothetical protein [Paracoccus yeei]|uniref:hypothetical protein n=1 Tax=Paracoccus yeei TaxID=147645 RepID=UPI001748F6A5|nr:hypothetical protein [Paracoccus yeei]
MPFQEPTKKEYEALTTATGLLLAEVAKLLATDGGNEKLERLRQSHLDAFEAVTGIGMSGFR